MPRRRRNKRARGGGAPWGLLAVLALAVAAGAGMAFVPTESFSAVALDRPGDMDVVIDEAGAVDMSLADCVDDNGWSDLGTITNRLNTTADVTVALQDPANGTLKGGSGGSLTFTLAGGASNTVEYKYEGSGPLPDPFDYDVSAVGTGVTADATRSANVTSDGTCDTSDGGDGGDGDNTAPTANFTYTRQKPNLVDVDASSSTDSDGTIVKYEWDVDNDGTIEATGETASLKAKSGDAVKLIVTDDDGATDSIVKTV